MKVLILGGAGFIGFHLAKSMAVNKANVVIADDFSRGKPDREIRDLGRHSCISVLNIDITKPEVIKRLGKGYDFMYHLAAINGTRYFYEIPHKVLRTNTLALINILDWLAKIRYAGKFIWTSSSEVYAGAFGAAKTAIPTPEVVPLVIQDVRNPRFSYAGSKIIGELFCLNYARRYGLDVTVIRPHNIYGPRMHDEHVVPEFLSRIIRKEDPFKIYGGDQTRSFCYIDDFIRGMRLIGVSKKTRSEIINLGSEDEMSIKDLAKMMFDLFSFHPRVKYLAAPEGSVARRCPDISKAKKLIGYKPIVNLKEGLRATYDWYNSRD